MKSTSTRDFPNFIISNRQLLSLDSRLQPWQQKHSLSCRFLRSNFRNSSNNLPSTVKKYQSFVNEYKLELFIKLQVKEFRIMALSINDSIYSCLFFFLTGLHFFHLTIGIFLLSLFFWSCSFSSSLLFSIEKECIFWN